MTAHSVWRRTRHRCVEEAEPNCHAERPSRRFLCLANPIPLQGGILFGDNRFRSLLQGSRQSLLRSLYRLGRRFRGLFRAGRPTLSIRTPQGRSRGAALSGRLANRELNKRCRKFLTWISPINLDLCWRRRICGVRSRHRAMATKLLTFSLIVTHSGIHHLSRWIA
jgi:hypothetical protein